MPSVSTARGTAGGPARSTQRDTRGSAQRSDASGTARGTTKRSVARGYEGHWERCCERYSDKCNNECSDQRHDTYCDKYCGESERNVSQASRTKMAAENPKAHARRCASGFGPARRGFESQSRPRRRGTAAPPASNWPRLIALAKTSLLPCIAHAGLPAQWGVVRLRLPRAL